jgi:hypothetical protein
MRQGQSSGKWKVWMLICFARKQEHGIERMLQGNHQGNIMFASSFTSTAPIAFIGKPHPSCNCDYKVFAFAFCGIVSLSV